MNFVNIVEFHTVGGIAGLHEHLFVSLDTGLVKWSGSEEVGETKVPSPWFSKWKQEFLSKLVYLAEVKGKEENYPDKLSSWSTYNNKPIQWNSLSYMRMVKYLALDGSNGLGRLEKRQSVKHGMVLEV